MATQTEREIYKKMGLDPERVDLDKVKAVAAARGDGERLLGAVEAMAARLAGLRPVEFLARKGELGHRATRSLIRWGLAVCARNGDAKQSLVFSHEEIDRAHRVMSAADEGNAWRAVPRPELKKAAIAGISTVDRDDAIGTYNDRLIGTTMGMRLLQLASGEEDETPYTPAAQGLLRAHSEIDRAHSAALTDEPDDGWRKIPIAELIAAAIAGLTAYDPEDEDSYEDDLLPGMLNAVRALDLARPAFADRKPLPGEKEERA